MQPPYAPGPALFSARSFLSLLVLVFVGLNSFCIFCFLLAGACHGRLVSCPIVYVSARLDCRIESFLSLLVLMLVRLNSSCMLCILLTGAGFVRLVSCPIVHVSARPDCRIDPVPYVLFSVRWCLARLFCCLPFCPVWLFECLIVLVSPCTLAAELSCLS